MALERIHYHYPKGATLIRSAAVVCIALAAFACAGDAPVSQPDPVATETRASTTAATPAPTPGAYLVQRTCPDSRANAGVEFEYDPGEFNHAQAEDQHCGGVVRVCNSSRENPGLVYEYDPDELTRAQATSLHCGGIPRICPETRRLAGKEYTHYPDQRDVDLSEAINCGASIPPSTWTVSRDEWGNDGEISLLTGDPIPPGFSITATTTATHHENPLIIRDAPELVVECAVSNGSPRLEIRIDLGGKLIQGMHGYQADVAYRFNDGPPIESVWDTSSWELWVPESDEPAFVRSLRGEGQLLLRVRTGYWPGVPRDESETHDLSFDLTGVDRDVEPVLQECGY